MQSQPSFSQVAMRWARRYWLALVVLGLAFVLVFAGQPVSAADWRPDTNQTVPPPTPRPTSPPAEPTSKPDNNNDSGNNSQPAQSVETPATTAPAGTEAETAGTAGSGMTAVVQAVTLNVRQGPGTTFPVIGKLPEGTTVTVLGRNQAGDWWNICCVPGGQTPGWVSAELLTPNFGTEQAASLAVVEGTAPSAATPEATTAEATTAAGETPTAATPAPSVVTTVITPTEGGKPATVTAVTLNVRGGPATDTPVIAKLKQNTAISVVGRNEAGDWLYICCLAGAQPNGWVSAEFVSPAFGATDLEVVAPAAASVPEASTPPEATETPAATETVTSTAAAGEPAATDAQLEVTIAQQPPFAVQGKDIALVFTVKNLGSADATDVELHNELPAALTYVSATAADGGIVTQEKGANGATVVVVTWPSVTAGGSTKATVQVNVASDVPDGTTFDNLAAVTAENAAIASAGITVGMPPSLLPEFW